MRYITIIISIMIYLSSLYAEKNLILYGISDDIYDATIKAKKLQQKINHSKLIKNKLIVSTMRIDNRWLIVSHINDRNIINKIALIVRDKYPSILIIKDKEANRPKLNIHKTSKKDTEIEWIVLTLIGIAGIFSMIWLLRKISRLKRIQNDLEKKQIELLNKILKSGRHYV